MKQILSKLFYGTLSLVFPQYLLDRFDVFIKKSKYYPAYFINNKCLFIHVTKNAGTSIELALFKQKVGHFEGRYLKKVSPRYFESFYKFAVIRNPYDRLVSAFHFIQQGGSDVRFITSNKDLITKEMTFEFFITKVLPNIELYTQDKSLWPQATFLCDDTGKVLVDELIRFENLAEDFAKVAIKLNIPASLPHRNSSKRGRDINAIYNEEMKRIVYDKYKIDFDTFNYDA